MGLRDTAQGVAWALGALVLSATALLIPSPGHAQDAVDARVRDMLAKAKDTYAVPRERSRCERQAGPGEIVVCAHDNDDKYRADRDDTSTDLGVPHADVGTHPPPGQVKVRGCFLQKCPQPLYLIDLSKIPLPPPGSDADLIARGEKRAP